MRHFLQILTASFVYLACLTPAFAQDDDKGFLTRTIQDALSGAGRTVSIDGFSGALSSAASFDRMTISDDDGIWLTLEEVVLDWNRSALLRGRLEVEQLTAGRLDVERLPVSNEVDLPDAEAKPLLRADDIIQIECTCEQHHTNQDKPDRDFVRNHLSRGAHGGKEWVFGVTGPSAHHHAVHRQ